MNRLIHQRLSKVSLRINRMCNVEGDVGGKNVEGR